MAQSKTAADFRRWNQDISGALVVAAATGDTTLVTARNANSTIWIQTISFFVTTDAAQSMSLEDSNGTAKQIALVPTSPGVGTPWRFNFGEKGVALTEGKDFVMNVSAAGLAGHLEWEGYIRLSSAVAPGTTN